MSEATPVVPHQASEFYTWLWWASESYGGTIDLGGDVGMVDLWVDERLVFRNPSETRVSAVMTGENPADTLEARAALAGGKVLQEVRMGLRREDREFYVTLRGPGIEIKQAKLPQLIGENEDSAVFDRMFLYEELCLIIGALLRHFSEVRVSEEWQAEIVDAIRDWVFESA